MSYERLETGRRCRATLWGRSRLYCPFCMLILRQELSQTRQFYLTNDSFSHKMARLSRKPLAVAVWFYASITWRTAEKRDTERQSKPKWLRCQCRDKLRERGYPLKAQGLVASYLGNSKFYPIKDTFLCASIVAYSQPEVSRFESQNCDRIITEF
jgi:hypothetical protein